MSLRLITVAAGLVGAALVFFWVNSFGVNVPFADDWDHIETSLLWHAEGLTHHSLLIPHNEHCLAIPRLLTYAILKLFGGNYRALLFFNSVIGIYLLAIVLKFIAVWDLPKTLFVLLAFAVSFLITSWSQWQNWLWAFQTPWFLLPVILFSSAVVIARAKSNRVALAAVFMATLLGPLCMANGLLVGWSLLPVLALRLADNSKGFKLPQLIIGVAMVLVSTIVGLAIVSESHGPKLGGLGMVLASPLQAVEVFVATLGSPLDPVGAFYGQKSRSAILGVVLLAVNLAALIAGFSRIRSRSSSDLGPGFALMTYGITSTAAVVLGRLTILVGNPVESRYYSFSSAWIIGLLLTLGWLSVDGAGWKRKVCWVVLMLISIYCVTVTLGSKSLFLRHGENMRRSLEEHQAIYRGAHKLGGRQKLRGISRHYGSDEILNRLERMRQAGILHSDYAPVLADQ